MRDNHNITAVLTCMLHVCCTQDQTLPPQYLCSEPPPQSSPVVQEFYPPCHPSCRNSEAEPQRHRSSWQTPQTWPDMARRSAPGITETPDSPSQESGDSLQAKTFGGTVKQKRDMRREKGILSQRGQLQYSRSAILSLKLPSNVTFLNDFTVYRSHKMLFLR